MTAFFGGYKTVSASCTAAATTTEKIDARGYALGSIYNESGGAVTVTWYGSAVTSGTPIAAEDEDGVAVSQTIGDDEAIALPSALAGFAYLYPVLGSGTATLVVHLER